MNQTPIKIGTLWTLKTRFQSPWDAEPKPVKVIDVKAGWVRYETALGTATSKQIDVFLELYEPVEGDWPEEIDT